MTEIEFLRDEVAALRREVAELRRERAVTPNTSLLQPRLSPFAPVTRPPTGYGPLCGKTTGVSGAGTATQ